MPLPKFGSPFQKHGAQSSRLPATAMPPLGVRPEFLRGERAKVGLKRGRSLSKRIDRHE
jgi:hypothetical protein